MNSFCVGPTRAWFGGWGLSDSVYYRSVLVITLSLCVCGGGGVGAGVQVSVPVLLVPS